MCMCVFTDVLYRLILGVCVKLCNVYAHRGYFIITIQLNSHHMNRHVTVYYGVWCGCNFYCCVVPQLCIFGYANSLGQKFINSYKLTLLLVYLCNFLFPSMIPWGENLIRQWNLCSKVQFIQKMVYVIIEGFRKSWQEHLFGNKD